MKSLRVAVIGATGLVGSKVLSGMQERGFPATEVVPVASEGGDRWVEIGGETVAVREAAPGVLSDLDLVFNCAGREVAETYLPILAGTGTLCVDKSTAFRMHPDVPLVVPEVNGHQLRHHSGIIASPNCLTIQLVTALAPLHRGLRLRRAVVSTYQSASGAGREALCALRGELDGGINPLPHHLPGNVIPQIGRIDSAGHSGEESKIAAEAARIFGDDSPAVTVTAVRVPVEVGHCAAVYCEAEEPVSREEIVQLLAPAPGLEAEGDVHEYCTSRDVAGKDGVFVGRIRTDAHCSRSFWMWIAADNLRKGAATNALQIAEALLRQRV